MLGDIRLAAVEQLGELANIARLFAQAVQDLESHGLGECPKVFGNVAQRPIIQCLHRYISPIAYIAIERYSKAGRENLQ